MKKNAGIRVLCGVIVVVTLLIIASRGSNGSEEAPAIDPNNINESIASQFNDNIRDVSARLTQAEKKVETVMRRNRELEERNSHLVHEKQEGVQVASNAISPEILATVNELKKEMEHLKNSKDASEEPEEVYLLEGKSDKEHIKKNAGVRDIDAMLIGKQLSLEEKEYWTRVSKRLHRTRQNVSTRKMPPLKKAVKESIPYYTVPAGSDLGNTTLLSALIGEVPVDGKLMQPLFPFSAIVSRGDLMASNGVPLPPDISGMKVNGYAIGVGSFLDNISCVRAYVTSVLFTFQDGHFVVVGEESVKSSTELVNNESLGYLSTPWGSPCIHGKYFTNAPRVLTAMVAAGGVQGVGEALSQWQMTYYAGPNGGAAVPTGSFGSYAAGGAAAAGAAKGAEWLEKRIQGSFDMVFVPASFPCKLSGGWCPNQVSLHLTKTIAIDKEINGRVLYYGNLQTYAHDFSLR